MSIIMKRKIFIIPVVITACLVAAFFISKDRPITVKKGFVFYDGKYIETPYCVSISGDKILINSHVVDKLRPINQSKPTNFQDPGIPVWVNKDTTLNEIIIGDLGRPDGLCHQKWLYLVKNNSAADTTKKFVAYVESLPCIKEVHLESPLDNDYYFSVMVTSNKGRKMCMIFDGRNIINPPKPPTKSERKNQLIKKRNRLVKQLESDRVLFYFKPSGPSMAFGSELFAKKFPLAIKIIRSELSEEEKIKLLKKLGYSLGTKTLVENFKNSQELNSRLAELNKQYNSKPMTMKELIAEPNLFSK